MAENAGNTEDSALTVKMMASSPASEKKHRSNGSAAPAHQSANHSSSVAGKQTESLTPPAVTEKKPQTNGQASPVRPPAISNNSQAGKQCLEGFLKTDDRMRLAKERREERERSLAAREQAIREKERRAQLQYERTVEERWKRLEEQRLKEEQRRAAVEEKRRQQLEEEKERLEALMRRSLERSLQLENRSKRWIWGGNGSGHGDWENAPPLSAASVSPYDLAAPSPAASESGNVTSSPHRSPYRGSPSRRRGNAAFTEEFGRGSNTAPSTPKRGSLRRERGMISPATGSPVRRPDDVIHRSTSPATPKLTPKRRNQSPVTVRQYPVSPLRHRPATPNADSNKGPDDKVTNDKQATKVRGQNPGDKKHLQDEEALKKSPDTATPGIAGKMESPVQKASSPGTPEKGSNSTAAAAPGQRGPAMGNQEEQSLKAGSTQKHNTNSLTTNKSTDQSPATPAEKAVTRMTDAEEVSRLLVERRHLAHVQKQQEEQERIKAELRKRQVDMQAREEQETRREEDELRARKREEEELEREREVVERQRQDRELMKQQEEEERQQRKKRIEEIMKRTRKNEGELKREDSQEPQSPSPLSPPGEIQVDSKPANEVKAPPSGAPVGSAPGSQAPLIGAQVRSNPSSQAPPTVAQARPTPGSQAPPTGAQAGSATDSWAKPPGTPSRQGSAEKRVERFVGSESMHAPAQVLPRSPSPNGQARSAKALDQKGNREHEKPQSNSTPRDEVRRDESSPAKGRPSQPKASAETSVQKPENIQPPARNRERAVAQEKARALVLVPRPQLHANSISPAVTQEQKGEAQVKNLASEKATILHESWALLQKSAAKMSDSPQVNGQGHQMKSQICTAQVKAQATPQPNGQAPLPVMSKGVVKERSPASHPPLAVSRTPPPLITLEPLEGRQGAREKKSADEVQSMEISPVSKEELISIPQFSPVADVRPNSMSKTRALEDLLDLTGQVAYPKLPPSTALGDCNKNLIEGMCSPGSETKVIANNPPASSKLNIQ